MTTTFNDAQLQQLAARRPKELFPILDRSTSLAPRWSSSSKSLIRTATDFADGCGRLIRPTWRCVSLECACHAIWTSSRSENVNASRLQSLGVEEYVWIATGGERYPRPLHHHKLNGQTFRYDDPPVIDEKTGVRGKPGDLIGCRCRQRAVLNFTKMAEMAA